MPVCRGARRPVWSAREALQYERGESGMTQQRHQPVWLSKQEETAQQKQHGLLGGREKVLSSMAAERGAPLHFKMPLSTAPSWGTAEPCRMCKVRGRLIFTSACVVSPSTIQHLFCSFVSILRKADASPSLSKSPREPMNALVVLCSWTGTGLKRSAPVPFPHGLFQTADSGDPKTFQEFQLLSGYVAQFVGS